MFLTGAGSIAQAPSPLVRDALLKPITFASGKKVQRMKVTCSDNRDYKNNSFPSCNTIIFSFDPRGKLLTEKHTSPAGERTRLRTFRYDSTGTLVSILDSLNSDQPGRFLIKTVSYSYDDAARTITEKAADVVTSGYSILTDLIIWSYSPDGKMRKIRSKLEHEKDTIYDTLIYDAKGRIGMKVSNGRMKTKYKYSKDGRLIEKTTGNELTGGTRWFCEYNEYGFLLMVKEYSWNFQANDEISKPVKVEHLLYTWNYTYEYYP
jgi:YD repeat-containing protein